MSSGGQFVVSPDSRHGPVRPPAGGRTASEGNGFGAASSGEEEEVAVQQVQQYIGAAAPSFYLTQIYAQCQLSSSLPPFKI
jgi:hypothetical protein